MFQLFCFDTKAASAGKVLKANRLFHILAKPRKVIIVLDSAILGSSPVDLGHQLYEFVSCTNRNSFPLKAA